MIFKDIRVYTKGSIGFRHNGWVWFDDDRSFIMLYLELFIIRIVQYFIQQVLMN